MASASSEGWLEEVLGRLKARGRKVGREKMSSVLFLKVFPCFSNFPRLFQGFFPPISMTSVFDVCLFLKQKAMKRTFEGQNLKQCSSYSS